jgi:hypothetical protein
MDQRVKRVFVDSKEIVDGEEIRVHRGQKEQQEPLYVLCFIMI